MSLAQGLSSALDTFLTVRDENRRSQTHKLQVEGHTLRNEGMRLSNRFDRETYDDRVGVEAATRDRADSLAGIERARLEVEEYLTPFKKQEGEADAAYAVNRAHTEGQRGRYWSSQASQQERSEDANVSAAWDQARSAEANAGSAELKLDQERLADVQNKLADRAEALGSVTEAIHDQEFNGWASGLANTLYRHHLHDGQKVSRIVPVEGGYGLVDNNGKPITVGRSSDPDDPVLVLSEGEVIAGLFGDATGDAVQAEAQHGQAQDAYASEAERIEQEVNNQVAGAERTLRSLGGVEEAKDAASTLEREALKLRGRIHTLEERKVRGFGSDEANKELNSEIDELETQLKGIDSNLAALGETHGGVVDLPEEEIRRRRGNAQEVIDTAPEALDRGIGMLENDYSRAQRAAFADPDLSLSDAAYNSLGRGPTAASESPSERTERQAEDAKNQQSITEVVDSEVDRVFKSFETEAAAIPTKDGRRASTQEDIQRVRRSAEAFLSRNDRARDALLGPTGDVYRMRSILSLASEASIHSGGDVGTRLDGILAGRNPEVIDAVAQFADDEGFKGMDPGTRYEAIDLAARLMEEDDMDATEAKTQALNWANSR